MLEGGDQLRMQTRGRLSETAEEHGRRCCVFSITDAGRRALREWLGDEPAYPRAQIRDPALLRRLALADLASAEDVVRLARAQAAEHRGWDAE